MQQYKLDSIVQLILPSELGYERIAMACSASMAKMHGFSEDRIADLKTIVAEAAINAMQHGNLWNPESRVTIKIGVVGDSIHISVVDEGDGFRGEVADPDIERIIEAGGPAVGFGLFLMRKLSDQIEFERISGGGHVVRMALRMQSKIGLLKPETHLDAINQG